MPDGDPPSPSTRSRVPAHFVKMHPGRIDIEIEVKIDIEIEVARDPENAPDMCLWLRIGVRATADQIGAGATGFDQKLVRSRIVEQALLRKDANLKVDRPGIIGFE